MKSHVTTALSLDEKSLQELNNGMTKEFRFYIDLFRVWKIWPDEFVLNKSFIRTLKCDPVKKEFLATSSDGNTIIQKRFKSLESMIQWALSINDLKLANTRPRTGRLFCQGNGRIQNKKTCRPSSVIS